MAEVHQVKFDLNPTSPSQTHAHFAITQSSLPQTEGADDDRQQLPEQLQIQQEEQETVHEDTAGAISHDNIHQSDR